jgi:uncharacterized protein YhbP (UPF0306 family)
MSASLANIKRLRVDGVSLLPVNLPTSEDVLRAIQRVLAASPLCAWSTMTGRTAAHVNIGHFACSDDLHLYLLSHPGSQHSVNLRANGSVAVAVYESAQDWGEPGRGVQLFGSCEELAKSADAEARRVYSERYPAYARWAKTLRHGDLAEEFRFYRFTPDRVKLMDEKVFGDGMLVVADIVRPKDGGASADRLPQS